jgi:hypothetical protein
VQSTELGFGFGWNVEGGTVLELTLGALAVDYFFDSNSVAEALDIGIKTQIGVS